MSLYPPLVLAACGLGAGVIAGWYAGEPIPAAWFLFALFPGCLFLVRVVPPGKRVRWLLFFMLLVAGLARSAGERRNYELLHEYTFSLPDRLVTAKGTVAGLPSTWREGLRFPLQVEEVEGKRPPVPLRWEVFLPAPEAVRFGERLVLRGRIFGGRTVHVTYWTRMKIAAGFTVVAGWESLGPGRVNPVTALVTNWRRRLLEIGESTLSRHAAAVLHGMLLGARAEMTEASGDDFRRAGVAHLLTVSGLHLLFWLSLFWGLGKLLRLSEGWLTVLSVPVVLVFLLLAGAGPPAMRAGVMALAALFGRWRRRPVRGENLLALAACVILLLRPLEIFSRGFWLSFAACAGLLFLFPHWERVLHHHRLKHWFRPLLASLAAQAGVLPLTARFFGGVTLLAPLTNLVLVPLGAACVQVGLTAALGGLVFFPVARLLNAGNEILLTCFHKLVEFFAGHAGYLPVSSLPWPAAGAFYMLTAVFTWGLVKNPVNRRRRVPLFYLLLILLLLLAGGLGWIMVRQSDPALTMVIFDAGQGDALLFITPDGRILMVDGGTVEGYTREVRPFLQKQGISRLDLLVLTHPHEDHLGGIVQMLEEGWIKVHHILDSGYPHTTKSYTRFLALIQERGLKYHRAGRGASFQLGSLKGMVLHPPDPHMTGTGSDINNNSVVLLLEYDTVRILLTGDIEREAEEEILSRYGGSLRADILKVAHHGGARSTSWEWVAAIRPELAVISVGRNNPFGHPSPGVLENLARAGARIWRTDIEGRLFLRIRRGRLEARARDGKA